MISRIFRFIGWEIRRYRELRKLSLRDRVELQRLEESPFSIGCPFCQELLLSGRSFRWHLTGHVEGDEA
jgi:hypothetical protein